MLPLTDVYSNIVVKVSVDVDGTSKASTQQFYNDYKGRWLIVDTTFSENSCAWARQYVTTIIAVDGRSWREFGPPTCHDTIGIVDWPCENSHSDGRLQIVMIVTLSDFYWCTFGYNDSMLIDQTKVF